MITPTTLKAGERQDPGGMTYLDFLGQTLGVLDALPTPVRDPRLPIAASPDLDVS